MNFFPQKQLSEEEKVKRVKMLKAVYDTLSKDPSMSEGKRTEILFGAFLCTGLTKNEVNEIILSKYSPGSQ